MKFNNKKTWYRFNEHLNKIRKIHLSEKNKTVDIFLYFNKLYNNLNMYEI